jgi:hypothetical protein
MMQLLDMFYCYETFGKKSIKTELRLKSKRRQEVGGRWGTGR